MSVQIGVGDTYFSGKLLARMARTILVAQQLGIKTAVEVGVLHKLYFCLPAAAVCWWQTHAFSLG